jgi:signal transduction histidine kinase
VTTYIPQDGDPDNALIAEGGIAAVLVAAKTEIFDRFVDAVRHAFPAGQRTSRPLILNTLPAFVTSLGLALSPSHARKTATEGSTVALTHGNERASLTNYSLDNLIHEYQVLRRIIFEVLLARTSVEPQDITVINDSVDRSIREATSAFVHVYDELRGLVAATLTHDLRGPLGTASNYLHLVQHGSQDKEKRDEYCAHAIRNLGRVRQMIDDLLDHSRASTGERLQLTFEPLELVGLVREVLADLRAANGDRYVLNAPEPIEGAWSGDAVKRAIHNLAENATKYGDRDSPVTVTLKHLQGDVLISVHNFGPAIAEEERLALFDAFRRGLQGSSTRQGWGLGLTAVKEIAQAHGGSVMVESSDSEGTTFTLQLFRDAREFVADSAS